LENRKKVLYVEVLKTIYGMLEAALFWYKTFRKDLKDNKFVFNPYNPCMANKKVQGAQQRIVFHVDDLKSSHKLKLVNDKFEKWLNSMYSKHGKFTGTQTQSIARKQKMNVQSSTEGKLAAVENAATMILWTKLFLEAQGYNLDKNIVYQDNKSAILLETNGKKKIRKTNLRTKHL
jgi:hypothetical protein